MKSIEKISSELTKEKLKNKDLQDNINQLKISLDKKTIELNNIKQNSNLNSNSKELLFENILKKDKEIEELKLKLSRYPFELKEGEKIISVIIKSFDQKVNYSIICKNTDKFSILEVNRYKTLDDNGIYNNSVILLKTVEM